MIQLSYSKEIDNEILKHENRMFKIYLEHIQKYKILFEELGFNLNLSLIWTNALTNDVAFQRLKFRNGYICYVNCIVESNGIEVCVKSSDGEADYYPLSVTWAISSIFRNFFTLNVSLYSNVDDVECDLKRLLQYAKQMY